MGDKKLTIGKIGAVPFVISIALIVLSAVMVLILDRYGIQGLLLRMFCGVIALSIAFICLIIGAVWCEEAVKKIKEKTFDFKEYGKGLILFLRSICVVMVLIIALAAICEAVKSAHLGTLMIMAAFVLAIWIFVRYVKYNRKHQSKQGYIVLSILLTVVLALSSVVGTKCVYESVSDMITKNTYSIDAHDIIVKKKRLRKGGVTYELYAYDSNNKRIYFQINKSTYKYYEESSSRRESAQIVCYEKSGVIDGIYRHR